MKKVFVPLLDLVQTVIKIKQISFPVNIFQLDSPFNFTGCPQTVLNSICKYKIKLI